LALTQIGEYLYEVSKFAKSSETNRTPPPASPPSSFAWNRIFNAALQLHFRFKLNEHNFGSGQATNKFYLSVCTWWKILMWLISFLPFILPIIVTELLKSPARINKKSMHGFKILHIIHYTDYKKILFI